MAFKAPAVIPGLEQEPNRALIKAFGAVALELARALAQGLTATSLKTADYTAELGELVIVVPPAAGMRVLLPAGTKPTRAARVQVAVLSVASGGTVTVAVVGGTQPIDAALTKTLSSAGLTEFACSGTTGWSATGSGGGGGLTPIADESFLANVSGAPAVPVATLLSSLAGTGLAWNPATNALDAAGGGTDPRIFAWWGV